MAHTFESYLISAKKNMLIVEVYGVSVILISHITCHRYHPSYHIDGASHKQELKLDGHLKILTTCTYELFAIHILCVFYVYSTNANQNLHWPHSSCQVCEASHNQNETH
jgi:hypothetical protein